MTKFHLSVQPYRNFCSNWGKYLGFEEEGIYMAYNSIFLPQIPRFLDFGISGGLEGLAGLAEPEGQSGGQAGPEGTEGPGGSGGLGGRLSIR